MSKDMFGDFDPYDALVSLNERMLRMEMAHNALANDYEKTKHDYKEFLVRYRALEESHLALSHAYMTSELQNIIKKP